MDYDTGIRLNLIIEKLEQIENKLETIQATIDNLQYTQEEINNNITNLTDKKEVKTKNEQERKIEIKEENKDDKFIIKKVIRKEKTE